MFMFLTVAGPYWNISNPRHNDAVVYIELPLLYLKQQGQQSKIGTSEFFYVCLFVQNSIYIYKYIYIYVYFITEFAAS